MTFPSNPSPGDSYTDVYNTVWIYAGPINGWYRQEVSTPNDTSYTAVISGPAGSNTQVQFNDNDTLAGDSGLTYNKTTDALSGGAFVPTGSTIPTNGLYRPSANNVAISTNDEGRLFVDSSGRLLVGTPTARTNFSLTSTGVHDGLVQYETTSEPLGLSLCRNSSGGPVYLSLSATGGSSLGSTTPVSEDDGLGSIVFSGMSGLSSFRTAALISAEVDAARSASNAEMPGRLLFSTTSDGASSPTERMRITSSGLIKQSINVPFGYEKGGGTYSAAFSIIVPSSNACWELAIEGSRVSGGAYGSRYQVYHIGSLSNSPRTLYSNAISTVTNLEKIQNTNGPGISVSSGVNGVLTVTMTGSGTLKYSYSLRQLNSGTAY